MGGFDKEPACGIAAIISHTFHCIFYRRANPDE